MITYLLSFVLLLGPLIFIHELGHHLFAKLFNVRVDVFSMGFGPKIFRKRRGETEYCLSIIPLGGYVKLLGQDPNEKIAPELVHRTLNYQLPWKRFLIFLGGPLFNFLFAIVIFSAMMMIGEPYVTTKLDRVPNGTAAHVAGFQTGDVITAVNGSPVTKFDEVMKTVMESINKQVVFRVKRANTQEIKEITASPTTSPGMSIYGEPTEVGNIDGLMSPGRHPVVGVSNPNSIAGRGGLKTGDEIVTLNGKAVRSYEELEAEVAGMLAAKGDVKEITLGISPHEFSYWSLDKRPSASTKASTELKLPLQSLTELGIHSSELFISGMVKSSPAEAVGLAQGDRLVAVDTVKLVTFSNLREQVQFAGEKKGKFVLTFERAGKIMTKEIVPNSVPAKDLAGKEIKQFMIGIYPLFVQTEPEMFIERIFNPITITVEAWTRALDLSAKTFISLKKLVTREVSMGTLGGPLLIGKLAGDSFERGVAQFLKVMALISISLAIFNILPVPILDGGHIVLLMVEVIRRKPITLKQSELVQQVGLTLILFLLVVVMFNDISRVGLPAIRRIFE